MTAGNTTKKEEVTDEEISNFIARKLSEGEKVALILITEKRGSAPRGPGTKMAIAEDGETIGTIGGGDAERFILNEALKALEEGHPRTVKVSLYRDSLLEDVVKTGQLCGGIITVFIDVLKPRNRVIIVGAGHMARALSRVLSLLGYEILVVDNFPQHANKDKLPEADRIIVSDDILSALSGVKLAKNDSIIIVHGDGDLETSVIEYILRNAPYVKYLGLLSGKGKLNYILRKLLEKNIDPQLIIKKLSSPIGLAVGSETPEEIAIAVAAEMLCLERREKCSERENMVPRMLTDLDRVPNT